MAYDPVREEDDTTLREEDETDVLEEASDPTPPPLGTGARFPALLLAP